MSAAQHGNSRGVWQLGIMYEYGRGGITQDFVMASTLYERAAQDGLPQAQYYLALMLAYGRGRPQSFPRAVTWFHEVRGR